MRTKGLITATCYCRLLTCWSHDDVDKNLTFSIGVLIGAIKGVN